MNRQARPEVAAAAARCHGTSGPGRLGAGCHRAAFPAGPAGLASRCWRGGWD